MSRSVTWSQTLTFFEGDWHDGKPDHGRAHACCLVMHIGI